MSKELTPAIKHEIGLLTLENKEALLEFTKEIVAKFDNLVVTNDEEQVKEIKKQRAELNKIGKAIDDKRKAIKKEFEKPLKAFEKDMKEVKAVVDTTLKDIDMKLDEVEQKRIAEKQARIDELITEYSEGVSIIQRKEWLNKTAKEAQIIDDIKSDVNEYKTEQERLKKSISTIEESCKSQGLTADGYIRMLENGFDVLEILRAISLDGAKKVEKEKAEQERLKQEQADKEAEEIETETVVEISTEDVIETSTEELNEPVVVIQDVQEPVIERVIKVSGTKQQLKAMHEFCVANGIVVTAM